MQPFFHHTRRGILVALLLFFPLLGQTNQTEEQKSDTTEEKKTEAKEEKKKPKEPEFEKVIEGYQKIEGLFTLYKSDEEGKVYLEIKPEQFETTYLCNITREAGDGYIFDSGAMLGYFPFYFKRVGKQVQFVNKNVKFRADPDAAILRAIRRDFSDAILGSAKVASQPHPERGSILIDAGEIFLQDLNLVGYVMGELKLGYSFDKENSYFYEIKSFPLNTEIEVALHFKSSKPSPLYTLADPRSMLHRYHYSLSTLPETGYKPRKADDRVGHFLTLFEDYTSALKESPYTRYITRWHLEKAEPRFKLSKPRQPIVFWLENTIPVEYRDAVREGVLLWNKAFERIGFKDAIEVYQMPDDADWDPADARYNTIRWIVTPEAAYAVGPSRANPFTGQIYDADIRVSADFVRFYFREFDEFVTPLSWTEADRFPEFLFGNPLHDLTSPYSNLTCTYSSGMRHQMAFGWNLLMARGLVKDTPEDLEKFIHDGIVDLIVHEVGHTLGLRHNFKASSTVPPEKLLDESFTRTYGISGSVMDYNPINLAGEGEPQTNFFQTTLGPYDYWAIEYAYKPLEPGSKQSEEEMLEEIARRVADPQLQYGTDEDAFGLSPVGPDPLTNLYDLSGDPIRYYQKRMELAQELWKQIPEKFEKKGQRYQKFRLVFNQGLSEYSLAAMNVSKFIGGIYMHRDHIGDPNGRPPFIVVPAERQRQALELLLKRLFAEDAFQFSPDLLNKLAPERFWDFEQTVFRMNRLDYPIHGIIQLIQATALFRLYNPLVLQRMQDNELRFQKGEKPFTMAEMFPRIREAIWSELAGPKNINSFRRELQRMHLYILTRMLAQKPLGLPHDAFTLARADLTTLADQIDRALHSGSLDYYTKAHLEESKARIEATLKASVQQEL